MLTLSLEVTSRDTCYQSYAQANKDSWNGHPVIETQQSVTRAKWKYSIWVMEDQYQAVLFQPNFRINTGENND